MAPEAKVAYGISPIFARLVNVRRGLLPQRYGQFLTTPIQPGIVQFDIGKFDSGPLFI
jgi:hypothetical protein